MHNYFVSFTYIYRCENKTHRRYNNCIMVDTTNTSIATASQLDDLVTRFTSQINQNLKGAEDLVLLNITKMN